MEISGNTVLITGGATGIGYAMAEWFLRNGNEVIICGRRKGRLLEAQKNFPELNTRVCDVASASDRKQLAEWATSSFKNLNILVNNAGIQRDIDFAKGIGEYSAYGDEIVINLEAPIVLCGLFIPQLTGKKNAAIINITSGLGFIPAARMPVYSATKAGIHAFTMALRHQLQKSGIKVFEMVPPAIDTELNPEGRAKRGNYKPALKPDEYVASAMENFKNDVLESGYGPSEGFIKASREEAEKMFQQMNSRW